MSKVETPTLTVFLGYKEAAAESGLPEWLIRKLVWDDRLPSYHPYGPRGRTFIKREDLYALMESSRKS